MDINSKVFKLSIELENCGSGQTFHFVGEVIESVGTVGSMFSLSVVDFGSETDWKGLYEVKEPFFFFFLDGWLSIVELSLCKWRRVDVTIKVKKTEKDQKVTSPCKVVERIPGELGNFGGD